MTKKSKICILVSNDLTHDPRVQKQAMSAAGYGYDVKVLAWMHIDAIDEIKREEMGKYMVLRGVYSPFKPNVRYFRLNLKLAKFNLPFVLMYPLVKIAKVIYVPLAKLRNMLARNLKKISIKIYRILIKKPIIILTLIIKKSFILKTAKRYKSISSLKSSNIACNDDSVEVLEKLNLTEENNIKKDSDSTEISRRNQSSFVAAANRLLGKMNSAKYYIHYYRRMNEFLIEEGIKFKPDIIHANDLDTLWAGWQIKKRTGAKLIYDAHEIWTEQGLRLPKMLLKFYTYLEGYLFGKVDFFVTVNESIAKELKKRYRFGEIPYKIVYNSPKYKKTNFRPVSNKEIKILYQGRYSVDRGLEELIMASRYFKKNLKLYFRGTGDEETQKKLREMVKNLKLESKIQFIPPVDMSDMIEAATDFDIGVIAYIPVNINNYYCLPNKIYEYMMAGLALAVSDLPELKRIVKENHNGITFNPRKPKDIARQINLLSGDLDKLNQTKNNSILAVRENNWECEELKLEEIYKTLTKL